MDSDEEFFDIDNIHNIHNDNNSVPTLIEDETIVDEDYEQIEEDIITSESDTENNDETGDESSDDEAEKNLIIKEETEPEDFISANLSNELDNEEIPKASNIYISTKTKIAYLNILIDLF